MSDEVSAQLASQQAFGGEVGGGLTIGVLGPVVVLDRHGHVASDELGGPKQRLVLSLLLCGEDQVVPAGRLIEGVWGGDPSSSTPRSLRAYVSRLRGVLDGVATIEHRHGGYALELNHATDASRFEQLVEQASGQVDDDPDMAVELLHSGMELWRGPPFGDLTLEAGLSAEVARLEQLRLRALELLARVEIDRGEQDRIVPELRRLVEQHPLREPLRRLLMLALYRSGRQAEALQEYERIRHVLAEELGADPSRELHDIHTAILQQDSSLDAPAGGPAPAVAPGLALSASTMVGRRRELASVVRLLGVAGSGGSQTVLITGEAGVGKSRLVAETAMSARSGGFGVAVGRCMEMGESTLPFAPIGQALRRLAQDITGDEFDQLLGTARSELARIVPELDDATPAQGGAEVRARLFAAVRDVLVRAAERRPLLMVVEDVHWADRSTLDLLVFLASSLDRAQLLLVTTFRTDEVDRRHPLRGVVGELVRLPQVTRIELDGLGHDAAAAMVAQILGEPPAAEFVDDVLARSSGNPFYIEELVSAAREGRSGGLGLGLRDVITSRLERLSERSRRLVEIAAVAGGSVDQRLLAEVTGEDPLVLAGQLRPTVERHVLVADDIGFRFRHDLVREVVVDELLPGERITLHRRIAAVLEHHPGLASGGHDQVNAQLAHHWRAAREDQRALDALLRAAGRARQTGAYADAMGFEEQALRLLDVVGSSADHDRLDILQQAAETAQFAGRPRRAIALIRQALTEVSRDPAREAGLRSELALVLVNSAIDPRAGLLEADRAVELVSHHDDTPHRARVVHTAARLRLILWDASEETIRLGRQAMDIARETGDELTGLHARITVAAARAVAGTEQPEAVIAQLRAALRDAQAVGDIKARARALNNLVIALDVIVDPDRNVVRPTLHEALRWLDEEVHGDYLEVQKMRISIARTAMHSGDTRLADQALAALDLDTLESDDRAAFLETRSELRLTQGQLSEALADGQGILEIGLAHTWHNGWAHGVAALVAAERGQVGEVRRIVQQQEALRSAATNDDAALIATLRLLRALVRAEVDAAVDADGPLAEADHRERAQLALAKIHDLHDPVVDGSRTGLVPTNRRHATSEVAIADAEYSRGNTPDPDQWRAAMADAWTAYMRTYARFRLAEALIATRDRSGADEMKHAHRDSIEMGAERLTQRIQQSAIDHDLRLESHSNSP